MPLDAEEYVARRDADSCLGYSYNGTNGVGFIQSAQLRTAATESVKVWSELDTGYLTPVDVYSSVNTYVDVDNEDADLI